MVSAKPNISKMYRELNRKYFGGKLPTKFQVSWSGQLTVSAGKFYYLSYKTNGMIEKLEPTKIKLSEKIFALEGFDIEKIQSTLLHEMIHLAEVVLHNQVPGHGQLFSSYQKSINALVDSQKEVKVYHTYRIPPRRTRKPKEEG